MMDFESILVPVDFSECSRTTVAVAQRIAGSNRPVRLSHAISPWQPGVHRILFPYAALGEDEVVFEHQMTAATREVLTERFGVEGEHIDVECGPAVDIISRHASRYDSSLVVMGSFGESGLEPGIIGSTAERVAAVASQPTLLVRPSGPTRLEKIVVALDLSPGSAGVYRSAIEMARQLGAELEAVFVVSAPLLQDHLGLMEKLVKFDRNRVSGRLRDQIEALFERMVEALAPSFSEEQDFHDLTRSRHILFGDPAAEIVKHVLRKKGDLVVMATRSIDANRPNPAGLGRVTSYVMRHVTSHLLICPAESGELSP